MSGEQSITVIVNGDKRLIAKGTNILDLLDQLGLAGRQVAVERNLDVIPRARHAEEVLLDGDRLEIVTLVGGG